jgi:DNA-directed RNA polymerase subunit B"
MYHWELVEALFKENPLVKQHLDSYNEFANNKIHRIIEEMREIETNKEGCVIKLHKIRLELPVVTEADGSKRPILPMEARLRNRTYAAPLFLEMSMLESGVEKDRDEVYIGDLPVMIGSDICHLKGMNHDELIKAGEDPYEQGGYFIVNGSEKVLVAIEDLAPNRMIVTKESKGGKEMVVGRIFSIKSGFRARITVERNSEGLMFVSFPSSPKNLNLFIIIKALGLDKKPEILEAFSDKKEVINDVLLNLENIEPRNQEEALDYIGKRVAAGQPSDYRKSRAAKILDDYMLPHVGAGEEDRLKKGYFLARMAERCVEVACNKREEDDKDHYANKRLKISGDLMDDLFRYAMTFLIKDIKYQIERAYTRGRKLQLKTLVRPDAYYDRMRFALATGTWVGGRQGISQLLDRTTYMAMISHLRRVVSPLSKTQPHFEARDLHPTHWGKLCPNETPEGQSCGLLKNLAMGCIISPKETEGLEKTLSALGVELIKK